MKKLEQHSLLIGFNLFEVKHLVTSSFKLLLLQQTIDDFLHSGNLLVFACKHFFNILPQFTTDFCHRAEQAGRVRQVSTQENLHLLNKLNIVLIISKKRVFSR